MKCTIYAKIGDNQEIKLGNVDDKFVNIAKIFANLELQSLFIQNLDPELADSIDKATKFKELVEIIDSNPDLYKLLDNFLNNKDGVKVEALVDLTTVATIILNLPKFDKEGISVLLRDTKDKYKYTSDDFSGLRVGDNRVAYLIPNGSIADLKNANLKLDWSGIDTTIPILTAYSILLNGLSLYGKIKVGDNYMYIVNPYNAEGVNNLRKTLKLQYNVLNISLDTLDNIKEKYDLLELFDLANAQIQKLLKNLERYYELSESEARFLEEYGDLRSELYAIIAKLKDKTITTKEKEELTELKKVLTNLILEGRAKYNFTLANEGELKLLKLEFITGKLTFETEPINEISKLLESYMNYPLQYDSIYSKSGRDISYILNNILRIVNDQKSKDEYEDSFTNDINLTLIFENGQCFIDLPGFRDLVKQKYKYLEKKGKSNQSESEKLLASELDAFMKLSKSKLSGDIICKMAETLLKSTDSEFSYKLIKYDGNKKLLYFEHNLRTFGSKESIPNFLLFVEVLSFKGRISGYNIYSDGKNFYVTNTLLTSKTYYTKPYKTLKEAQEAAAKNGLYKSITKTSFHELMRKDSSTIKYLLPTKLLAGLVIEVYDYNIDEKESINILSTMTEGLREYLLDSTKTLNNFYDYIKEDFKTLSEEDRNLLLDKVKLVVDDAQALTIFVYEYYKLTKGKELVDPFKLIGLVLQIVEEIKKKPTKRYIVESVGAPVYNLRIDSKLKYILEGKREKIVYATRLVLLRDDEISTINAADYNQTPMFRVLDDFASALKAKFNIDYKIATIDEINLELKLGSILDVNTKAFIKDGKIYINIANATKTDIMHEYSHLFLGVLKAKNFDTYEKLVDTVTSDNPYLYALFKKKYPYLAESDLKEEMFAEIFGEYLANKNLDDLFILKKPKTVEELLALGKTKEEIEEILEKAKLDLEETFNNTLFTKDVVGDDFFNQEPYKILALFSRDINIQVSHDNGLELSSDPSIKYRKATNWILSLIQKNGRDANKEVGIFEKCD